MNGLNRIFIMGFLGSDPQTHPTKTGKKYTSLSIATHRHIGGVEGEGEKKFKQATDWHYVRVWGKEAETCARYLSKGNPVLVEGYLTQYAQQREGKIERRTSIHAIHVDFLPRNIRDGGPRDGAQQPEDGDDDTSFLIPADEEEPTTRPIEEAAELEANI